MGGGGCTSMCLHYIVLHLYPATSCDWRGWRYIIFPGLLGGGCHNSLVAQMVVYNCTLYLFVCWFVWIYGTTVQDAECQTIAIDCLLSKLLQCYLIPKTQIFVSACWFYSWWSVILGLSSGSCATIATTRKVVHYIRLFSFFVVV